ncbi:MAG: hypothetical protein JW725_03810 [Candidatus Babeliaceae bacterium]|nr:hypothetical protein [Candidatus Babeliaceae bacterium]
MKHFLISVATLITLLSSFQTCKSTEKQPCLIVIVHGTIGVEKSMNLGNIVDLFRWNIDNSAYKKRQSHVRQNPRTYDTQATQGLGMQPVIITNKPTTSAELFVNIYQESMALYRPNEKLVGCYTYGWSALLNIRERCLTAYRFWDELKPLVQQYKSRYPNLKIKFLTFSLASDITLRMAQMFEQDNKPFYIDELIMWGSPIKCETICFSTSPFFKRIYHFYSRCDHIVRLDIFRTASKRTMDDSNRCKIPKKLTQVEVKISVRGEDDPCCCKACKRRFYRSPIHSELWNFGTPYNCFWYRRGAPLFPLPTAILTEGFINAMEKSNTKSNHIVFEIRPDQDIARIRPRYKHCYFEEIPFVSPDQLTTWKDEVSQFYENFKH